MKRVLSLALATLLLAGCTTAPAADSAVPAEVTNETAATQMTGDSAPSPAPAQPLRPLQRGDESQYYMTDMLRGGLIRCWIADLNDCRSYVPCDVEGCSHDSLDCPAVFARGDMDRVFVLDEDTLVYFGNNSFPETSDSDVVFLDRNCQNPRTIATVEGAAFDALGNEDGRFPYTDGRYLYCFGWRGGYGNRAAMFRIDPESGEVTDLLADAEARMDQVLGAVGTKLLFVQWELEGGSDDPSNMTSASITATVHWALDLADGTLTQIGRYERVGDFLPTAKDRTFGQVLDGQYYQIDLDASALRVWEPETSTFRSITDALPASILEDSYPAMEKVQDWIVFPYSLQMVNVKTGEVREKPALPENCWNGVGHQPSIYLNLGDTLLVDCRYEPYTRTDIGPDGTPATVDTNRGYLGLISAANFLNGVPNYTEVGAIAG